MKTTLNIGLIILVTGFSGIYGQENTVNKADLVDLKIQLIDSKLALLDSKIKIWETRPQELDLMLDELNDKLLKLDFKPDEINQQFNRIDSMIREFRKLTEQKNDEPYIKGYKPEQDSLLHETTFKRYSVTLNPVRIFEGTLEIACEKRINSRNTIEISGMATYANSEGVATYYLEKQSMEYFNSALNAYDPYNSDNFSGFGVTLQWKNYLLPSVNSRYAAFEGLYAAPYTMFRRIWITGLDNQFFPDEDGWREVEIIQKLNILAGGVIVGWQFPVAHVLSLDVFLGGVIRLCHYDTEGGITKYKKWQNIDYSGVMPRAGIKIGILK